MSFLHHFHSLYTRLRVSGVILPVSLAALLCGGCLSRQVGPSLPYIKPAVSTQMPDPSSVHIAARIEDMEAELQRLRARIEQLQMSGGDNKAVRDLQERVGVIEQRLNIRNAPGASQPQAQLPMTNQSPMMTQSPTGDRAPGVDEQASPMTPYSAPRVDRPRPTSPEHAAGAVEIQNAPVSPDEKLYRDAYMAYKAGQMDQAAALFDELTATYPKSRLVADAIYWVGEARLAQGRFDEAVLQFDRVLKEFPGSKKELNALLKQAEAFDRMGDAKSSRIIYQKITSDHPHTAQGRIAAAKLKERPRSTD